MWNGPPLRILPATRWGVSLRGKVGLALVRKCFTTSRSHNVTSAGPSGSCRISCSRPPTRGCEKALSAKGLCGAQTFVLS